jgi:hypothetical protein
MTAYGIRAGPELTKLNSESSLIKNQLVHYISLNYRPLANFARTAATTRRWRSVGNDRWLRYDPTVLSLRAASHLNRGLKNANRSGQCSIRCSLASRGNQIRVRIADRQAHQPARQCQNNAGWRYQHRHRGCSHSACAGLSRRVDQPAPLIGGGVPQDILIPRAPASWLAARGRQRRRPRLRSCRRCRPGRLASRTRSHFP